MKWWLLIWLPFTVSGQIRFDEIVHDYGLIKEDGNNLYHRFHYANTSEHVAEIIYLQPSCGCTVPHFEKRSVYPGEQAWIEIEYHPKDRPGYFLKPVEIGFLHRGDTLRRTIAVKGYAMSGTSPVFADQGEREDYVIRIAPVTSKIRYADKWNVETTQAFTDFVNDLTFVIDQFNFAEVRIDLTVSEFTDEQAFSGEMARLKKHIQSELVRRNYGSYQVGFITEKTKLGSFSHPWLGSVKLSSVGFNDELIETSIIKRKNDKPISETLDAETISRINYAASSIIHYIPLKNKKPEPEEYQRFVEICTRNALTRKEIWIGLTVKHRLSGKRVFRKNVRRVKKDLINAGIPEKHIHIHPLDTNPKADNEVVLAEYLPYSPDSTEIDSLEIFDLSNYQPFNAWSGKNRSLQDLPAYFQLIRNDMQAVDTNNRYFRTMMQVIIDKIKSGDTIDLLMESSASKSPSVSGVDNIYTARVRAERSKKLITAYMLARGLKHEDIRWRETIPLISGPEYDLRHYLPSYYIYFQYLKVIPVHQTITPEQSVYIPPYKMNFTYQDLEVLNNSAIFQSFVNRLAEHINTYGFVKIIIESSSSRIPTRKVGNPKHLSYHRAQAAKNSIYEEIQKRGINPSRVIITEERTLVQGPEFKNDYKENAAVYEKFQYVKILPEQNLMER